jgi:hypothetical protein
VPEVWLLCSRERRANEWEERSLGGFECSCGWMWVSLVLDEGVGDADLFFPLDDLWVLCVLKWEWADLRGWWMRGS